MTIRRFRILALAAALCCVGVTTVPPASAAPAAPAAMIRGGHFSPNTPGVDVYLTSFSGKTTKLWLSGVKYGDVSGYQRFAPGLYSVSMRPHGAAASTPAVLTWTLDAHAGDAYTACAVGLNAHLHGIVLDDDLKSAPGSARVRVIQAASRAPDADVVALGQAALARNLRFGTSSNYSTVRSGNYNVEAHAATDAAVHATARTSFAPDSVHTVVVLDAKTGGITVRVLDDATGAAVAPDGPAPAGGGGTAAMTGRDSQAALQAALYGVLAIVIASAAGVFALRRRPSQGAHAKVRA